METSINMENSSRQILIEFPPVVEKLDVWNLAMAVMTVINLVAIVLLGKIALKVLQDYQRQRQASKKNIVFKASSVPELKDSTSEWK